MILMLIMQQKGEGCDYTIGCGKSYSVLASTNMEDAKKEAMEEILERTNSETEIEYAVIVEAKLDVSVFGEVAVKQRLAETQEYERSKKREQLEKLKRELGES